MLTQHEVRVIGNYFVGVILLKVDDKQKSFLDNCEFLLQHETIKENFVAIDSSGDITRDLMDKAFKEFVESHVPIGTTSTEPGPIKIKLLHGKEIVSTLEKDADMVLKLSKDRSVYGKLYRLDLPPFEFGSGGRCELEIDKKHCGFIDVIFYSYRYPKPLTSEKYLMTELRKAFTGEIEEKSSSTFYDSTSPETFHKTLPNETFASSSEQSVKRNVGPEKRLPIWSNKIVFQKIEFEKEE